MSDLSWVDWWRLGLMTGGAWLLVLTLRLAWLRWRENRAAAGRDQHSPLVLLGLAGFLLTAVVMRPSHLGEGVSTELVMLTGCAVVTGAGVVSRVRLSRRRRR